MLNIEIHNQQSAIEIDEATLRAAISGVLEEAGLAEASVSLAIVTDERIHELNRQFLSHDYVTDVLSFVLEQSDTALEGEIIVSAETAQKSASKYGWRPHDELLLYVIHGALHLVGHDDQSDEALAAMRAAERSHLARFELRPHYGE